MSYSNAHEASNLRTYAFEGGAQGLGGRVALLRCLRPPSLPDPFSQLSRRAFSPDSRKPTLRPTNCAQRHPRLQRKRPRFPKAGLFASQRGPRRIRRAECPRLAGDAPPGSEEVRQRRHLVDTGVRRTSQLREGSNQEVGNRTDHPSHPGAPWGALAESETLDRKSGSRIRRKKGIEIG